MIASDAFGRFQKFLIKNNFLTTRDAQHSYHPVKELFMSKTAKIHILKYPFFFLSDPTEYFQFYWVNDLMYTLCVWVVKNGEVIKKCDKLIFYFRHQLRNFLS